MNYSPTDVEIDRLRIKGPKSEQRGAITEVERADWPHATHNDWIIIREIKLHSSCPWLGIRAAAIARRMVNAAVDGGSPGAERADAVRFCSFTTLLACLSIDLAMGCAASKWYWQRWAYLLKQASGDALQDLWIEHIAYLPAVTAHIAETGMLPQVWQTLTTKQTSFMLAALSRYTGSTLTTFDEVEPAALTPESVPEIPAYLQVRWRNVIRDLPANDARRWLAVSLLALEWRPLLLTSKPATSLRRISQSLMPPASQKLEQVQTIASSYSEDGMTTDLMSRPALKVSRNKTCTDEKQALSSNRTNNVYQLSTETNARSGQLSGDTHAEAAQLSADSNQGEENTFFFKNLKESDQLNHAKESGEPISKAELSPMHEPSRSVTIKQTQAVMPTAELEMHTAQGGLFYLVNLFNRPEVAELIEMHGGMTALPDGWAWLYRLGRELKLDQNGSLALFLAQRMGFDSVSQLTLLPPLPARQPMLDLVGQLYGQTDIWNAALLNKPAWIRYSPSHLDVYYPLSVASLAVRLAGLDINPGWVPWLGRVVTFYYQEIAMMPTEPDT